MYMELSTLFMQVHSIGTAWYKLVTNDKVLQITIQIMSFAIVRVEVRGSSCVRVELGNSSKIPRVSIPRQLRGNVFRNSWTMSKKFFRSNQPVFRSCNRPVEVVYRNTLIPVRYISCFYVKFISLMYWEYAVFLTNICTWNFIYNVVDFFTVLHDTNC